MHHRPINHGHRDVLPHRPVTPPPAVRPDRSAMPARRPHAQSEPPRPRPLGPHRMISPHRAPPRLPMPSRAPSNFAAAIEDGPDRGIDPMERTYPIVPLPTKAARGPQSGAVWGYARSLARASHGPAARNLSPIPAACMPAKSADAAGSATGNSAERRRCADMGRPWQPAGRLSGSARWAPLVSRTVPGSPDRPLAGSPQHLPFRSADAFATCRRPPRQPAAP